METNKIVTELEHKMHFARPAQPRSSDPPSNARKPRSLSAALGQVSTPASLAALMAKLLIKGNSLAHKAILDPCVGDGRLLLAVAAEARATKNARLVGVDIDQGQLTRAHASASSWNASLELVQADYMKWQGGTFDYAILNPPYVRQEWMTDKHEYRQVLFDRYKTRLPGTANLYSYFLIKVVHDLVPGGKFVALVYDALLSTRVGQETRRLIEERCESIKYCAVPRQPFDGHLIDAVIVAGEVKKPGTRGRRIVQSRPDAYPLPFVRLDKGLTAVRGLRLKQANIFLTSREDVEKLGAIPFVKKIQHARPYAFEGNHPEAALLIYDSSRAISKMRRELSIRLKEARSRPDENRSILTWHQQRPDTWFKHRPAPAAPILFNYYIRGVPRHLLNPVGAYSDNFYGLTWTTNLSPYAVLAVLNSTFTAQAIRAGWRSQGGGLHKIQLFEFRAIPILDISRLENSAVASKLVALGKKLAASKKRETALIARIDLVLQDFFGVTPADVPQTLVAS